MKICNIYPVKDQKMYEQESYAMILAHLIKKYDSQYFKNKFVIMDNGLYEKQLVSSNLSDLVEIAENSKIRINEIVIPDVMNDFQKTIELFNDSIDTIRKWDWKYSFMFVAQVHNERELKTVVEMFNEYPFLNITLGMPKRFRERTNDYAISLYKQCDKPIHFLGLNDTFDELNKVKDIIRSCDSAQLTYEKKYGRSFRKENDFVDLEYDNIWIK